MSYPGRDGTHYLQSHTSVHVVDWTGVVLKKRKNEQIAHRLRERAVGSRNTHRLSYHPSLCCWNLHSKMASLVPSWADMPFIGAFKPSPKYTNSVPRALVPPVPMSTKHAGTEMARKQQRYCAALWEPRLPGPTSTTSGRSGLGGPHRGNTGRKFQAWWKGSSHCEVECQGRREKPKALN